MSEWPEFLSDSSPIVLIESLKKRGAVLLRQILPPHLLTDFLPHFQQGFAAEDQRYISGQMPAEIYQKLYCYGHAEPGQITNYYVWIQSLLQVPALKQVLQAIYGASAFLLINNAFPRRQDPAQPAFAIPFHQDQEFTGCFQTGINLWLPLTPAGQDFPGLELCLDSPQEPLFQSADTAQQRQQIIQKWKLLSWKVELQPGDALVFTGFTPHRTCMTKSMSQIRYSAEIRLISATEKSRTQAPLLPIDLNVKLST